MAPQPDYEALGRAALAAIDAGQVVPSPILYECEVAPGQSFQLRRGDTWERERHLVRWVFRTHYYGKEAPSVRLETSGLLAVAMLRSDPVLAAAMIVTEGRRTCGQYAGIGTR